MNATWAGARPVTVLDWAEPALALGREIAAANPELKSAEWHRSRIGSALTIESTIVTVSYVLGELTDADRASVVTAAATAAQAVVIIEPGTPDGYARVIEARDRLITAGFHVAAPCPHSAACPIVPGEDWCHFSARVARLLLHRQVKGGSLPYEDEKFSYVAATRLAPTPAPSRRRTQAADPQGPGTPGPVRPRRGPAPRDGDQRHGPLYRAARDADWGDAWPPPPAEDQQPGLSSSAPPAQHLSSCVQHFTPPPPLRSSLRSMPTGSKPRSRRTEEPAAAAAARAGRSETALRPNAAASSAPAISASGNSRRSVPRYWRRRAGST